MSKHSTPHGEVSTKQGGDSQIAKWGRPTPVTETYDGTHRAPETTPMDVPPRDGSTRGTD